MLVTRGVAFWRRPPRIPPMHRQVRSFSGGRSELDVREIRRWIFRSRPFFNWSCRDHLLRLHPVQSRSQPSYSSFQPSPPPPPVLIVFDLESTGLIKKEDRIVEIAARDLRGGERGCMETLVNPRGRKVHPEAFKAHKISNEMLRRAPGWDVVGPAFVEWVESRRVPGAATILLAHNGFNFDIPLIKAEFERTGVPFPHHWQAGDTFVFLRQLYSSSKLVSYSMNHLIPHFQVKVSGVQHRAMYDVDALAEVLSGAMKAHKMALPDALHAWGGVRAFGEVVKQEKKMTKKKVVEKSEKSEGRTSVDSKWDKFAKGITPF